ncbi:hypothetical protein MJN51_39000, partial [Salmonella enterica subsp. enterica serovar Kentucky]|nr:hypothetical protein [Salmonella enterica subsp. enterica serovar Kentucky]
LTGYTLAISQDHTYAVDSITANTTGNVLTNDVAPTDALLTEVPQFHGTWWRLKCRGILR